MFEIWEGVWQWKRVVWSYQGYCLWCWKSMLIWLRRVFCHMSINICNRPTYAPSAQMWQKPAPRLSRFLLAASAPLWTNGLNESWVFMEHGSRGWREDCGCISPGGHLLMSKVEKEKSVQIQQPDDRWVSPYGCWSPHPPCLTVTCRVKWESHEFQRGMMDVVWRDKWLLWLQKWCDEM